VRTGFLLLALVSVAGSILSACSAPSNEDGGDARFALAEADGGACSALDPDAGSGTAWSDLYRDYFGPTGEASCAGNGQCHGNTTQAGYLGSGYVCGPTAAECYTGITSTAAGLVTVGDTTDDPTLTPLYTVLRKCSGTGSMPKLPADLMFTSADMARIAAWIKAGAPNN
jgi:hypothetical protein